MQKQSGNVLFLILIAVALFAALSYAVTSSTRTGAKNITAEKQALDNGVTDSCTASAQAATMRLQLVKTCPTAQISYELPGGGNENPDAPTDKHCHLFHPNGGNIAPCGTYKVVIPSTPPPSPPGPDYYSNGDCFSPMQSDPDWIKVGAPSGDWCNYKNTSNGSTCTGGCGLK